MRSRAYLSRIGVEGALMVLSPLPLLFPAVAEDVAESQWLIVAAAVSVLASLTCALTLFRKPALGKASGVLAALFAYAGGWQSISQNPFIGLTSTVALISVLFVALDFKLVFKKGKKSDCESRCEQRARWGALTLPAVVVLHWITERLQSVEASVPHLVVASSLVITLVLYGHWSLRRQSRRGVAVALIGLLLTALNYLFGGFFSIPALALLFSVGLSLSFPKQKEFIRKKEHWWDLLLSHPARILLTTFLAMCVLGIVLLSLPASTEAGSVSLVDAAFTSVSAVCVTGLTVLDTPHDFTGFGQLCILFLIQIGGLGIMSITTVALHAMGQRLSLKQERLMTSMTDTDHKNLVFSLKTILRFTFGVELIGALLLWAFFLAAGDSMSMAAWRGLFTSISAFCNAGFALQSDNLVSYQGHPMVLHTVAGLIILGGMAPAVSLMIPRWLARKPVPIPARIALITTAILLFGGTFFILAFEWNGILRGLSVADKLHNAWFQSVTLRTAGFNSVDLLSIANPTFLIMLVLMFIGGSPGGTAGGIKTTTVGILAMTFWANVTNKNDVVIQNRRIPSSTVYRAVTIVVSGMMIWFLVMLMLQATQQISARDLIFEATSAIGTVGLTIGATPLLDPIGKVIIIIAMFAGRIGPMTLFMLLSEDRTDVATRCPEEKISLS